LNLHSFLLYRAQIVSNISLDVSILAAKHVHAPSFLIRLKAVAIDTSDSTCRV
jgi:hypothetical protein